MSRGRRHQRELGRHENANKRYVIRGCSPTTYCCLFHRRSKKREHRSRCCRWAEEGAPSSKKIPFAFLSLTQKCNQDVAPCLPALAVQHAFKTSTRSVLLLLAISATLLSTDDFPQRVSNFGFSPCTILQYSRCTANNAAWENIFDF